MEKKVSDFDDNVLYIPFWVNFNCTGMNIKELSDELYIPFWVNFNSTKSKLVVCSRALHSILGKF